MTRGTVGRFQSAGALALLIGLLALAVPPHPFGEQPTWETLLAPYSTGAPLPHGFRVRDIRRGPDNGVVVSIRRPDDGAAVEVLVVERGRWSSVHQSESFTIDYELPRSPAAEREVITALLADTIRARDPGLPAPDAVPLRADDSSVLPWGLEMLRGTPTKVQDESQHEEDSEDRILVPLAMPMIAGPGAIATVITFSAKAKSWEGNALIAGAILITGLVIFLTLYSAAWVQKRISARGQRIFLPK